MQEPITYSLAHTFATVELSLTSERLIANSKGNGLLDKPKIIDIPLSDLQKFCLVPTIAAQNVSGRQAGEGLILDSSYDAEFIFSYLDAGQLKKKRMFVNSQDATFRKFLEALKARRPDASLLHLEPAEGQQQIGVVSASKAVYIIVGIIVGIPVVIALISLISAILGA